MTKERLTVNKTAYALVKLLSKEKQTAMYEAIMQYGFNGTMPNFEDEDSQTVWAVILPYLKSGWTKQENGKKGGAPKNNRNAAKDRFDLNRTIAVEADGNFIDFLRQYEDIARSREQIPTEYQCEYIVDNVLECIYEIKPNMGKESIAVIDNEKLGLIVQRIREMYSRGERPSNMTSYIKALVEEKK